MTDVGASLRPCEIDVELDGRIYTIPAIPASEWLEAILGEGGAIIPDLLDRIDQHEVAQRLINGNLTLEAINQGWQDALAVACGRTWWSASRLVVAATDKKAWPVVQGRLTKEGVNLDVVSIGAFCNRIFVMLLDGAQDEEQQAKIKFELEIPPPGALGALVEDKEQLAEDFMTAMRQLQQASGGIQPDSA